MENIDHFILGETSTPVVIDSSDDNRDAALALTRQAKQSLRILSHDLDNAVYNNVPFIEAVTKVAIRSRYSTVQILVQDSTNIVTNGHRLLELSHRLSSLVKIRKPSDEHKDCHMAFLIADERGLLHRPIANRYEGTLNFNTPREARDLAKQFDEMWQKSEPDPKLRRFYI